MSDNCCYTTCPWYNGGSGSVDCMSDMVVEVQPVGSSRSDAKCWYCILSGSPYGEGTAK